MDTVEVDVVNNFPAERMMNPLVHKDGSETPGAIPTIKNGFAREIPDLNGVKYFSSQRISKLLESPRHYEWRYILGNKDADTPAKMLGKLTHWALLQPKEFLSRYLIQPKFSGAGMKKAKSDWLKSIPKNSILITEDQASTINHMIEALHAHPQASKLLSKGTPEVYTFFADHEFKDENGQPILWFGIIDFVRSGGWIIELKTTRSAKRKDFVRDLYQNGYHIQTWKYRRMFHGITGKMPEVAIIAVENTDPFCVEIFEPKPAMFDQANYHVTMALESFRECSATGYWHSYTKDPIAVGHPPEWLKSRFEQDEE